MQNIRHHALASLSQLKYLVIRFNLIEDVTPLSNLTQLIELNLSYNQIVDVHPLARLSHLEKLWIQGNQITDHSPLDTLSLQVFEYDEFCLLPRLSITERMQKQAFSISIHSVGRYRMEFCSKPS